MQQASKAFGGITAELAVQNPKMSFANNAAIDSYIGGLQQRLRHVWVLEGFLILIEILIRLTAVILGCSK